MSLVLAGAAACGAGGGERRPEPAAAPETPQATARRGCDGGDPAACAELAIYLVDGDGVAEDDKGGFLLAKRACDAEVTEGCRLSGQLLLDGEGVERDPVAGTRLLAGACAAGDVQACYPLGLSLEAGWAGAADPAGALRAFASACTGGIAVACPKAGALAEKGQPAPDPVAAFGHYVNGWQLGDQESALAAVRLRVLGLATWAADIEGWDVKLYEAGCGFGSQAACVQLGWIVVPTDAARAWTLAQAACDAGASQGCTLAGHVLLRGGLTAANATQAAPFLERGCTGGDALACSYLGMMLHRCEAVGGGVACDEARARTLLRKGCDGKIALGCTELAVVLARGAPAERKEARTLAEAACVAHDGDGCAVAGRLRRDGVGGARDAAGAATALETACTDKRADACLDLGSLRENAGADGVKVSQAYLDGCNLQHGPSCIELARLCRTGVARLGDAGEIQLYQATCGLGDQPSCVALGAAELEGRGITKDEAGGVARLAGACQAGDQDGCAFLGVARLKGLGGAPDPASARAALEPACAAKKALACAALGTVHAKGLGVKVDGERARGFMAQACKLGDAESCDVVKRYDAALRASLDEARGIIAEHDRKVHALYGKLNRDAEGELDELAKCERGDLLACEGCLGTLCGTPEGLRRLEAACVRGVAGACWIAGDQWREGNVHRPKDKAKAIPFFDKACIGGVGWACRDLATSLATSSARDEHRENAALRRGCDLDDGASCRLLASRYRPDFHGGEVQPDPTEARRFLRKACDQLADYPACAELGYDYLHDYNVKADQESRNQAKKYLDRACELQGGVGYVPCKDAEVLK